MSSRPTSRADWLAARAMLASRRLRPFRSVAVVSFGLVFLAAYLVRGPLADRAAARLHAAGQTTATEHDTLPLVTRYQETQALLVQRDSALRASQFQAQRASTTPVLSAGMQQERDSLRAVVSQLNAALDRAAKAPLPASYRALADTRALRQLGAVQALVDTLVLLEQVRQTLDPVAAPQSEFAQLSQRANAIGGTLQGIGQARNAVLARRVAALETRGEGADSSLATFAADTAQARARRDSARLEAALAESLLRDTRQWHAAVQARADSAAHAGAARFLGASPVVAGGSAVLMVFVVSFTLVVLVEARRPTIAHAREVERLTELPVIGLAESFRVPREGRARLQSGTGTDPFRMTYLELTASGNWDRVVCVTGDDALVVAAAAGRLAVSAAADERATLLVDLAPGVAAASAFFGWRDEPGFTEAVAGVRLWREVARPVGASEGLSIEVIPAGGPRHDTAASVQDESARAEFAAFISEYDFTVLVAPNSAAVEVAAAVCRRPLMIITARVARTQLRAIDEFVRKLAMSGALIHGILLIDEY